MMWWKIYQKTIPKKNVIGIMGRNLWYFIKNPSSFFIGSRPGTVGAFKNSRLKGKVKKNAVDCAL